MNTEELKLDGYTVTIEQDLSPSNPCKDDDGMAPLLCYYLDDGLRSYKDAPETTGEIVDLIPASYFKGKKLAALRRELLNATDKEWKEQLEQDGDPRTAFASLAEFERGSGPTGWKSANEWLEWAESVLDHIGIVCHSEQSNGYSQGDSCLLLAVALPDWIKRVGCPKKLLLDACKSACEVYGAFAWGDCYGYSEITDPDGNDIDESCWGFYGSDHKASGLLEMAQNAIDCHKAHAARERQEAEAMACRDIVTV